MGTRASFLGQTEDVEQRRAQFWRALRDTCARDAAIGAHEQHGVGEDVEPRLERACPVTDDRHIGVVVAGPIQLGHGPCFDEAGPQRLPAAERLVAENGTQIVTPAQHGETGAEYVVEQDVLIRARIDAGLDEQRARR